ncbi:hypothetical protein [Qipengyuania sp. JC766]|uniref:hypothetical protein n=1 Tax=Qipengyuania sp. JC766 TaxID=3232139 RepID=UPI003458017B
MRGALLLAGALVLSGCITQIAESRVRSALVDAGVGDRTAGCMAGRMVDRLTIDQLRKLEELKKPADDAEEDSLEDYLDRVARVGDAEVLTVTSTSAALCQIGLAE